MENYSNFVQCFVCSEEIKDARILPCFHSVCFECLKKKYDEEVVKKIDKLNCPKCNISFEVPIGGLGNLKKNEFIQCLTSSMATTCGLCSKTEVTHFCPECNFYLCLSCISIHQKIPSLKNHILAEIDLSRKRNIKILYCESCKKWVDSDKASDHTSCQLTSFSVLKQNLFESLQQGIAKNNNNIGIINGNLSSIDSQKLSVTQDAEELKQQIQQHCEKIKNYADFCTAKLIKQIDQKCKTIEEPLDFIFNDLSQFKTELEEQNNKYKNMLHRFDPTAFVKAVENDILKIIENDENILKKSQDLFSKCPKDKLDILFEPNMSHDKNLSSQNLLGILKPVEKIKPQLTAVTPQYAENKQPQLTTEQKQCAKKSEPDIFLRSKPRGYF